MNINVKTKFKSCHTHASFNFFSLSFFAAAFCQINWPWCDMSYFLSQLSRAANTRCTMKWNTFWSSFCKLMQCLLKKSLKSERMVSITKSANSIFNKNERDFAPWSQVHNLATCNRKFAIWQLGNFAIWQFGNLARNAELTFNFGNFLNLELSILATFNFGNFQFW